MRHGLMHLGLGCLGSPVRGISLPGHQSVCSCNKQFVSLMSLDGTCTQPGWRRREPLAQMRVGGVGGASQGGGNWLYLLLRCYVFI